MQKSMQKISKYLIDTPNTQGVSAELEQRNAMTDNEPASLPACLPSVPLTVDLLPLISCSYLFLLPTPLRPLLRLRLCCSLLRCSVAGTKVQLHKLNRASRASTFCQPTPHCTAPLHLIAAFNDNSQVGVAVGGRWE